MWMKNFTSFTLLPQAGHPSRPTVWSLLEMLKIFKKGKMEV